MTNRRLHARYPVTLTATFSESGRSIKTTILDVSAGGLLISGCNEVTLRVGSPLDIEAVLIGRLKTRVVEQSERGIHLKLEEGQDLGQEVLGRLAGFSRLWSANGPDGRA